MPTWCRQGGGQCEIVQVRASRAREESVKDYSVSDFSPNEIIGRTRYRVQRGQGHRVAAGVQRLQGGGHWQRAGPGGLHIVDGAIIDGGAVANNGLSYTWNFGDGQIVTETIPNITYAFVDDSTRNVVLTVTDIAGNSAPTTMTVDPGP